MSMLLNYDLIKLITSTYINNAEFAATTVYHFHRGNHDKINSLNFYQEGKLITNQIAYFVSQLP